MGDETTITAIIAYLQAVSESLISAKNKRWILDFCESQAQRIEELELAIAYAAGRLEQSEGCPTRDKMPEALRMLADERAAWIEVAVDANKALDAYLYSEGVELPYGMPVDGAMQLARKLKAENTMLHEQVGRLAAELEAEEIGTEQLAYLRTELATLRADKERLVGALEFYADPHTYFAVAVITDPPCGDFGDDFSDTEELGSKPGKRAREALKALAAAKEPT